MAIKKILRYRSPSRGISVPQQQQDFFKGPGTPQSVQDLDSFFKPTVGAMHQKAILSRAGDANIFRSESTEAEGSPRDGNSESEAHETAESSSSDTETDWFAIGGASSLVAALVGGPTLAAALPLQKFNKGLPHRLLFHYTYGGGKAYQLSVDEMRECKPEFDFNDPLFLRRAARVIETKEALKIWSSTKGIARNGGTLNQFTINYNGTISPQGIDKVKFLGEMTFHDNYDFDPHYGATKRTGYGQFATGYGSMLPGDAFEIRSTKVMVIKRDNFLPHW